MVLTYVKTVWVNLKAPYITCNRLNKIENHISAITEIYNTISQNV